MQRHLKARFRLRLRNSRVGDGSERDIEDAFVSYRISIDAFVIKPETQAALEKAQADRRLAKSKMHILPGGCAAAAGHYAEHPTPSLILVEETDDDKTMMDRLGQLAEVCEPGTKVMVIGQLNDIGLYRALLGHGVSEYLVTPIDPKMVLEAVDAIFSDPAAPPRGRVIAVFGARGGVGASTLAQNLAWSIARQGDDDVLLVDMDVPFGTAGLGMNAEAKQTIADALAQPDRLDAQLLEKIVVKRDDHLALLVAPALLAPSGEIQPEAVERIIDVARQAAGIVVLDIPHIWSAWVQEALVNADELVIVATPDLAALRDSKNIIDFVSAKRGVDAPPRLVLTRQDPKLKTQLSTKDFEETTGLAPTLVLAMDYALFGTAANNGQTLGEVNKTHKIVEAVDAFAQQVSGRVTAAKKKKGGGFSLADLLKHFKK